MSPKKAFREPPGLEGAPWVMTRTAQGYFVRKQVIEYMNRQDFLEYYQTTKGLSLRDAVFCWRAEVEDDNFIVVMENINVEMPYIMVPVEIDGDWEWVPSYQ